MRRHRTEQLAKLLQGHCEGNCRCLQKAQFWRSKLDGPDDPEEDFEWMLTDIVLVLACMSKNYPDRRLRIQAAIELMQSVYDEPKAQLRAVGVRRCEN